jgi:quercetin dioxygenase-like cupin family protein
MQSGVENLAESIDYQDGAVVSRTVLKKATGTVTLFAFDRGEGLSEHTTPFDALVHVLDGNAEVSLGGVKYAVEAGQAVVMPAGVPHALKAVSRFKMILTMIRSNE